MEEFKVKLKVIERTTCNNSWNTENCYDGLLRGENMTARSLATTVSGVIEYGAGAVTPTVNLTVNVSNGGGVSPALEYFEFVSDTLLSIRYKPFTCQLSLRHGLDCEF